jgi:6,7-dimethyl-8-ribityllumazine synthase
VKTPPAGVPRARGLRIAILRSSFNSAVVDGLVEGARAALAEMQADPRHLTVVDVPGAFELPLAAAAAARSGRFDALVALAAVIRGETDHYEHIAREASTGLATVSRETGIPVGFGVLTVAEEAQARARAGPGPSNKGAEAARAAVAMVHVLRGLRGGPRDLEQRAARAAGSTPDARAGFRGARRSAPLLKRRKRDVRGARRRVPKQRAASERDSLARSEQGVRGARRSAPR